MVPESPRGPRRPSEIPPDHRPISADYSISAESSPSTTPHSTDAPGSPTSPPTALLASPTNLEVPVPGRPRPITVHSANSSTALLGEGAVTPGGTSEVEDPFDREGVTPEPVSPVEPILQPSDSLNGQDGPPAAAAGTTSFAAGANAPQIKINSIPTTPTSEVVDVNAFQPRPSFSAPFASSHDASPSTILKHRRSSATPSALSGHNYGSTSYTIGADGVDHDSKRFSAQSNGKKDFAQRRSMRAKAGKNGKKERESRDFKGTGGVKRKPFESTRLKGEIYKPWLDKKDPAQRWARWITIASILIGIALAGFLCYNGYASVPNLGKTCLLLDDNFNTLDTSKWTREVRLDGYGPGSFQWTTASDNNSFVDNGILYIVPTLSSDHLGVDAISNGYTLNLTADGSCTSNNVSQCVAVSNSSRLTVINPVQSARLITKNSVNIKYGKVEVVAKFPTGDWLWPRISMLPSEDKYGAWPRNGQIDILSGRGNNASYPSRGFDYAQSDLHWGPTTELDRLYLTWGYREQRRTYYNQKWHTYGLEWNEDYMWTYIDSKVSQVISLRFAKESFWQRGKFPSTITNTTTGDVIKLLNPWVNSPNVAPFDQSYYLALDLAVGSTDGWFPDGQGGKPWIDNSGTSMSDFWNAKERWWNQWPSDPKQRAFAISSVKIWETC